MRATFLRLFALCLSAPFAAAACSRVAVGDATEAPPDTSPPSATPATCEAREVSCSSLLRNNPDELGASRDVPSRVGAVVWAQVLVPPTAEERGGSNPKVAIYADGTLRRTPVMRNLYFMSMPPRGLLVASVAAATLARVRTSAGSIAAADLRGYFQPARPLVPSEPYDVFELTKGSACSHPVGDERSACMPSAVAQLQRDVVRLAGAAEEKWRAALSGTVSIGPPMQVNGDWPLPEDRAVDGAADFPLAEWRAHFPAQRATRGVWRLPGGDFVSVDSANESPSTMTVYLTRMSSITLDDDALRTELLAHQNRYELSAGTWLGVELGADRFPAFKNREIAVVPSTGTAPATVHRLHAIERLDLRGEGEIAIP